MTNLLDLMGCAKIGRPMPAEPIARYADLSPCGLYRWTLRRQWGGGRAVGWLMLNPSKADAKVDDPTMRRVISFTEAWGYRAANVVNLYPFRSASPKAMMQWRTGPDTEAVAAALQENWNRAAESLSRCDFVVAAYGALNEDMAGELRRWIEATDTRRSRFRCLGLTAKGWPKHPMARGAHRVEDGTKATKFDPLAFTMTAAAAEVEAEAAEATAEPEAAVA